MSQILRAVLVGQHPSGKNQIRMSAPSAGVIRRFPQKSFEAWRGCAYAQLDRQRGAWVKLTEKARITVRYTSGDLIGRDVPGMEDALWHLLEWCPIHQKSKQKKRCRAGCPLPFVLNDNLLACASWEEMDLDRENPLLEFTIEPKGAKP